MSTYIACTIIVSFGVDTAANGEAVARYNMVHVVTEYWAEASELGASSCHIVLEYQLGIQIKTNYFSGQTLRCSECLNCAESHTTEQ